MTQEIDFQMDVLSVKYKKDIFVLDSLLYADVISLLVLKYVEMVKFFNLNNVMSVRFLLQAV